MVTFRGQINNLFNWIDDIFAFPTVEEPKPSFTNALAEIVEFNKHIKQQPCPNCGKKDAFVAIDYERGSRGFEAKVFCTGCATKATVNNTGFHYEVHRVPGGKTK